MHRLQLRSRLDTKILVEHPAGSLIGVERFCLPPGAVERQHAQTMQALPVWMGTDEPIELGDDRRVPSQRQTGGDPVFEGVEPQLVQAGPFRAGERGVREVGQNLPPPQLEGPPQRVVGAIGPPVLQQSPSLGRKGLEPGSVQIIGADRHPVAGRLAHEHPGRGARSAGRFEQPPQVRHVRLE